MSDNFFVAALKHPTMKYLVIIGAAFLLCMLIWAGCKHKKRCDENRASKFLGDECFPLDTIAKTANLGALKNDGYVLIQGDSNGINITTGAESPNMGDGDYKPNNTTIHNEEKKTPGYLTYDKVRELNISESSTNLEISIWNPGETPVENLNAKIHMVGYNPTTKEWFSPRNNDNLGEFIEQRVPAGDAIIMMSEITPKTSFDAVVEDIYIRIKGRYKNREGNKEFMFWYFYNKSFKRWVTPLNERELMARYPTDFK